MGKSNTEAGEVMQCLIEHKNDVEMNRKCSTGIEHHQLVCFFLFELCFLFSNDLLNYNYGNI